MADAHFDLEETVETLYFLLQFEEHFQCKVSKKDERVKQVLQNFDSNELLDIFYAANLPLKKNKAIKDKLQEKAKALFPKLNGDDLTFQDNEAVELGVHSAMLLDLFSLLSKSNTSLKSEFEGKFKLDKLWSNAYEDDLTLFFINSKGTNTAILNFRLLKAILSASDVSKNL